MKKKQLAAIILCTALLLLSNIALAACVHDWRDAGNSLPTCDTDGYYKTQCSLCGAVETNTIPKYGHSWSVTHETAPTCTSNGDRYLECNDCGQEKVESIKPTGHKWKDLEILEESSCSREGSVRTRCSVCSSFGSRKLAKLPHDYGAWVDSYPATDHSMGERSRSCKECGYDENEEYYPEGTLYRGAENDKEATKELQQLLTDGGYLRDKIDGVFGKKTEAAVKACQREEGFEEDGIAWPQTIKALRGEDEVPEPTDAPADFVFTPAASDAPETTAAEASYPSHCARVLTDDGKEALALCEKHAQLQAYTNAGLTNLTNPAAREAALEQSRSFWAGELDALYATWLEVASEDEIAMVAQSKSIFLLHLNEQQATWSKLYASKPEMAAQMVVDAYIDQCIELCGILSLYEGAAE